MSKQLQIEEIEASKSGNYDEASRLNKAIDKLKKQNIKKALNELSIKHKKENEALEQIYLNEKALIDQEFSERMKSLSLKKEEVDNQINQKQTTLKNVQVTPKSNEGHHVKYSKSFYEYKIQEENLAKSKKYSEAKFVRLKVDKIAQKDIENYKKITENKMKSEENKNKNKLKNEISSLNHKLTLEEQSIKNLWNIALETALKRYKNKKMELENQQQLEVFYNKNENKLNSSKFI